MYLEDYISATEKVHKAHAKEYEKVLKVRYHGLFCIIGTISYQRSSIDSIESIEGRSPLRPEFRRDRRDV